jgi:hypothetical protein
VLSISTRLLSGSISIMHAADRCRAGVRLLLRFGFSRSFRARFGVAPRDLDLESIRRARWEAMQESLAPPEERHRLPRLPIGENPDGFAVTVRKTSSSPRRLRPRAPALRTRSRAAGGGAIDHGQPRAVSPMGYGSATGGKIRRSSRWISVATTSASKFPP